jgi:uncharacterized membrane protein
LLIIAFKLKATYKSFSSVLIAGAFTVFYLTIAIAFHDYKLFNPLVAFIIMVCITLFSTYITIVFDRIELAALSLTGGFAVPFMINVNGGNATQLWLYILLLNVGFLIIASRKKWIYIQWQSIVFTQMLFNGWLFINVDDLTTTLYPVLVFAFIFYLIFMMVNIQQSIQSQSIFNKSQYVILLSSTFIFFIQVISILDAYDLNFKGLFAIVLF